MGLEEKKVSNVTAETAAQQTDTLHFDSPDQVINQGTQRIMDTVGDAAVGAIDQAKELASPVLLAGGVGFSGMKLFKGILEDDSLGLDDGPEL